MQYKEYFAIEKRMKAAGWHGDRAELISDFTAGKKDSLKALSNMEYRGFIASLQTFEGNANDWQNSPNNRMRRKLWYLFVRKMDYTTEQFNEWVVKYGKFHKPLKEHNADELTQLLTQVELVYKSYINQINKK